MDISGEPTTMDTIQPTTTELLGPVHRSEQAEIMVMARASLFYYVRGLVPTSFRLLTKLRLGFLTGFLSG